MRRFRSPGRYAAGLAFFCAGFTLNGQLALDETANILGEWVETERQISESKTEWETDRAGMRNLIAVYSQEIELLTEQIEVAESDVSAAESKRTELNEREDRIKTIESKVETAIIGLEIRLKKLEAILPPPLRSELAPLFNALPENPEESKVSIGQRVQPIAAILTQVQKFNQVVTLIDDFREFEAGRTVQIQSVYFGLGAAFYVDQANEHAGYAIVGEDGWSWQDDDSLALEVRNFIDIYTGKKQAEYVGLPISVR